LILMMIWAAPLAAQYRVIDTRDEGGPWLHVVSAPEVVFDHSRHRCFDDNFADLPVRAIRNADGVVRLYLSHNTATTAMVWRPGDPSPAFDNFAFDCTEAMTSPQLPGAALFANNQWLGAAYTTDGETVHALVHNEFQGHLLKNPRVCPSGDYFSCWYNSITYLRSDDGGRSFARPVPLPRHLVAAIPMRYLPDGGPVGAFSPSNIVRHDGYFHAIYRVVQPRRAEQNVCLIRTPDLADPAAWRFWHPQDGFARRLVNPYIDDVPLLIESWCPALAADEIANMHESLVYHPGTGRFILVGTSSDPTRTPNIQGFYYAFSEDLITWTRRRPLLEVNLPWTSTDPWAEMYLYPSLIDPDSPGFNFEFTDDEAYLYFTRLNWGQGSFDRDLLRVSVQIGE